jgi:ribonuclease E
MHSPNAQLKSGGYIVINPTEALVSIDVNSGRATRGRNIEETALKTNLEASDEIARQLKLRDLAGLIVIDYIDMEVSRNQTKVEYRLKEAMRSDRARIQIGRISPFGLLELSRQRMRPSLIENSSDPCPYCEGTGIRRSADSAALHLLRAIKEEALKKNGEVLTVHTPTLVALHIFNNQRDVLAEIEKDFKISIIFESDNSLIPPSYRLEIDGNKVVADQINSKPKIDEEEGKRRKRRGRRRTEEETSEITTNVPNTTENKIENETNETIQNSDEEKNSGNSNRRRRGRRGGRRRGRKAIDEAPQVLADNQANEVVNETSNSNPQDNEKADITSDAPKPKQGIILGEESSSTLIPLADTESNKIEKEKLKKPTRRSRTQQSKKTDVKPAAKKEIKKSELTPTTSSSGKHASGVSGETKTNSLPESEKVKVPSKQSEQKSEIPLAASAKTQVISVGTDKNAPDVEKKSRKGWWR